MILTLIQIGGMGVVTVAVSLSQIAGKRIGLASRFLLQESIGAPQIGGIIRLLRFILRMTLTFEGLVPVSLPSDLCPSTASCGASGTACSMPSPHFVMRALT